MLPSDLSSVSELVAAPTERGGVLLAPRGECGCGFGVGDLPAGTWTLRSDLRVPLESATRIAARKFRRFRFSATWLGDPPSLETAVSLEQLIVAIREGVVANRAFLVR
jgi:hypothetical protein